MKLGTMREARKKPNVSAISPAIASCAELLTPKMARAMAGYRKAFPNSLKPREKNNALIIEV